MKRFIRPTIALLVFVLCLSLVVSATGENCAPVAENLELTTYRGVSVGGRLSAIDPDGDTLTFEIVTPPNKGEIELGDDGCFVYTPAEGRKGKDYFGYKAVDSQGNCSQEATVIIRIVKQKTKVCYSDMSGSPSEYSAVMLAENGIFVGENLAGQYVFSPDSEVSRAEFLSMCMKLTGVELLGDVTATGFADDAEIYDWLKPYVSTALKCGIISGYSDRGSAAVFDCSRPVSVSEAAVILDKTLDLTDTASVWVDYEETVPVWASQSAANLTACGMIPYNVSLCSPSLTRAQAADMLVEAARILDNR